MAKPWMGRQFARLVKGDDGGAPNPAAPEGEQGLRHLMQAEMFGRTYLRKDGTGSNIELGQRNAVVRPARADLMLPWKGTNN